MRKILVTRSIRKREYHASKRTKKKIIYSKLHLKHIVCTHFPRGGLYLKKCGTKGYKYLYYVDRKSGKKYPIHRWIKV